MLDLFLMKAIEHNTHQTKQEAIEAVTKHRRRPEHNTTTARGSGRQKKRTQEEGESRTTA